MRRITSDLPQIDGAASFPGFDEEVLEIAGGAISVLRKRLLLLTPFLAGEVDTWMEGLPRTGAAPHYFLGGRAILLLLPRFLCEVSRSSPDLSFERDLAYSTVSAYYFVRLIDDVIDNSPAARHSLLPLLGFFHAEFQRVYGHYLKPDSVFWDHFHRIWGRMADATVEQGRLTEISVEDFRRLSAARSGGLKIPLAAACEFYQRPDLIPAWCAFFDQFAVWSQMLDDIFDWASDYGQGTASYFLSEARRRKGENDSVSLWILEEGLDWGYEFALSQLRELRLAATGLETERLLRFIDYRQAQVAELWRELHSQSPALARLALAFED